MTFCCSLGGNKMGGSPSAKIFIHQGTIGRGKHLFNGRSGMKAVPRLRGRGRSEGAEIQRAASANHTDTHALQELDLRHLRKAASVSVSSQGLFQPNPYSGCVLVNPDGRVVAEAHQKAQGTVSAEAQAVAATDAYGCTAYLNLEPGWSEGGWDAVNALVESGVQHVVMGMLNPIPKIRGCALKELRRRSVKVSVLGMDPCAASEEDMDKAWMECLSVNEALMHRAATQKPLSILKYAMTLDGKIAAYTGHSAWVSSPQARKHVFATRAVSNAVIVGGNTVRRDNPNLTSRMESGYSPVRIVMSRTMDLQSEANLWNISLAPTIVMTQRGARTDFQQELRDRGIEVVEFDFLSPEHVATYCYERGFIQLMWECGGALSAPAIASGVIHKIMAFVSPKIIGGSVAPTPCGDLGFVEMTQAVRVTDMRVEQVVDAVGPDVKLTGYLPASGGLRSLHESVSHLPAQHSSPTSHAPPHPLTDDHPPYSEMPVIKFYKCWDEWGAFSNIAEYPIRMPKGAGPHGRKLLETGEEKEIWRSVEHYYQAQKFAGVENAKAVDIRRQIQECEIAEDAAKIGRHHERQDFSVLRPDWYEKRVEVMKEALLVKYRTHDVPRNLLLSTDESLVENSPHDFFWGCGIDGSGENRMGQLLMFVRATLQEDTSETSRKVRAYSFLDD